MDKYNVVSLIGEGSFGRVYKANKKSDENSTVAIKIISKLNRSIKDLKNLRRECNIQVKLDHPNIIKIYESFETKTELILVTEYLPIDLHRYLLKNGPIPENKVQILSGHLVSALYYLHTNRILHRDLKPQNVLLDENFHSKLCDFGLARNMTMGTHVLTSIKGTPLYMAPEILSEKPYDHQADLWSLGCIIYECLVRQPPFCTSSILQLIRLINLDDVKWPSFISNDCVSLLQGLLEKNPSLRFSWAQILCHPFLDNKLNIPEGCVLDADYMPKPTKKKTELSEDLLKLSLNQDNLSSSKDSTNAILQSDIENIETDIEDQKIMLPFSEPFRKYPTHIEKPNIPDNACVLSGNSNLVIANFNDYFQCNESDEKHAKQQLIAKNTQLEKRKLNQNLENSQIKLNDSKIEGKSKKANDLQSIKSKSTVNNNSDEKLSNSKNAPPCLPNGWDSCDSDDAPAIENDEWFAFLNRTIQEILDGEIDSLQEQNFVSIIIAPLRNIKATPIYEQIAKLICLPLVIQFPSTETILNVYIELKVVPNLVYASKLITSENCTDSISLKNSNFKNIIDLNADEIQTLDILYESICHLAHLNEKCLLQFCDAMAILSINELLIMILNSDLEQISRCISNILALFCCVLISNKDNVQLIENIIYDSRLNLIHLMRNHCETVRERTCILFRILCKFSSNGLRILWTSNSNIREGFELLACDDVKNVRTAAENLLNSLKSLSFY